MAAWDEHFHKEQNLPAPDQKRHFHKQALFTGAATALVTPFSKDGTVALDTLGTLIERQIRNGIDALVICGTTGESATLSAAEHRMLLQYAAEKIDGRVPMIAGCGSNNTAEACEEAQYACAVGADALLVITPYYNKATPTGLIRHFTSIADASTKPIILYNVPSRTGVNIPLSVYHTLAGHERIVAVKEASGNIAQAAQIAAECTDSLFLYSGCDELTLPILSLGGCGVISVVSNLLPQEVHTLCDRFFRGDIEGAKTLQLSLLPLINALFTEVNPIPVKTACGMLGLCRPDMRLPLCEMEKDHRAVLHTALTDIGLFTSAER